jgi:hypothetical protein
MISWVGSVRSAVSGLNPLKAGSEAAEMELSVSGWDWEGRIGNTGRIVYIA